MKNASENFILCPTCYSKKIPESNNIAESKLPASINTRCLVEICINTDSASHLMAMSNSQNLWQIVDVIFG